MSWNENWIKGEDYPTWGDTIVYKYTISLSKIILPYN